MLTYQNQADIDHKYAGSIMYYDGKPVMVFGMKGGQIAYEYLGENYTGQMIGAPAAKADDPKFAEGPFRLGYINDVDYVTAEGEQCKTVCFASRVPIRRWKQGLFDLNMDFRAPNRAFTFAKALKSKGFVDMMTNTYPTIQQAWKRLDDKVKHVAYNRHWAVGIGKLDQLELYYRGNIVGMADGMAKLTPSPKYEYLKEAFELSK